VCLSAEARTVKVAGKRPESGGAFGSGPAILYGSRMRPVEIGGVGLHMESPEAARYFAPILILPGLFQSSICWRGFTSTLAHRGWEVYLLPRSPLEGDEEAPADFDQTWSQSCDAVERVASNLGDKVIVFGADVGAGLALATLDRIRPMALGLFAPAEPAHVGGAFSRTMGMFEKRRFKKASGPVEAPNAYAKTAYQEVDIVAEPRSFVRELIDGVPFSRPDVHPPAIVFGVAADPLVENDHAMSFADTQFSKASRSGLNGRWWPSLGWEAACEEAHRFLILTLSDRIVDFPDEIIGD
jgi:pimeloyl-ACP methyl ester carboxylesterase